MSNLIYTQGRPLFDKASVLEEAWKAFWLNFSDFDLADDAKGMSQQVYKIYEYPKHCLTKSKSTNDWIPTSAFTGLSKFLKYKNKDWGAVRHYLTDKYKDLFYPVLAMPKHILVRDREDIVDRIGYVEMQVNRLTGNKMDLESDLYGFYILQNKK